MNISTTDGKVQIKIHKNTGHQSIHKLKLIEKKIIWLLSNLFKDNNLTMIDFTLTW